MRPTFSKALHALLPAIAVSIAGGCANQDTPELTPAHHLAEAHILASICRDGVAAPSTGGANGPSSMPTPLTAAAPAKLNEALAQRAAQRSCGIQPHANRIETGSLPKGIPEDATRVADAPSTVFAEPPATASTSAHPRAMSIRFMPSSIALPESDRETLASFLAKNAAPRRQVRVTISRGGAGNAFDQLMVANNRITEINRLLVASVVATAAFDPSLPDDVARIEID